MKLFISYSRKDTNAVIPIIEFLQDTGQEIFFDKDSLVGGEEWETGLGRGVQVSDAMLFFVTQHSVQSEWCSRERMLARLNKKPIIPILIETISLPSDIQALQWVDAQEQENWGKIIRAISQVQTNSKNLGKQAKTEGGQTFHTEINELNNHGPFVIGNNVANKDTDDDEY